MTANRKILLVDDDAEFRESNRMLLDACGYQVFEAGNGEEALKVAEAELPDLIILDVMMTYDTEGFDVARKIRSSEALRNIRILLVSGIVSEKKLQEMPRPDANWLPVDRVLEKPIDPARLLTEIERALENA